AWNQKFACDTSSTCSRFLLLSNWNNEAVLDRETGLVWERTRDYLLYNWADANRHCNRRTTGGRLGWRLPTVQELASLVDPTVKTSSTVASLPPGHPFTGSALWNAHWSATRSLDPNYAWIVSFWRTAEGSTGIGGGYKGNTHHTWCVNNGPGH
ncbi:MAG TPA: DUF1566 domain-containing protein, partial [Bryobacteraceae bacterium]|nr:DUF1566 domain-containing protein [Bryobacteraceae bacterium]